MPRKIFQTPEKYRVTLNQGYYRFQCWGAQGGSGCKNGEYVSHGGPGAYVSGYITINTTTTIYCYVGGKGGNGSPKPNTAADGGFNGGGKGGMDLNDDDGSGGGGGATDIRLIDGDINDEDSLKSRIIVAAGGSGSAYFSWGAPGGDLKGYLKTSDSLYSITMSNSTSQEYGY